MGGAAGLTVWVLISVAHLGKLGVQPQHYLGVYATEAACEHMLTSLSDPDYALPGTKPSYMKCLKEIPKS